MYSYRRYHFSTVFPIQFILSTTVQYGSYFYNIAFLTVYSKWNGFWPGCCERSEQGSKDSLRNICIFNSDGILVNIDGNSNRVSCIAQGPRKVVFIVGINKVCSDLDSAMKRARNVAAPVNAQRFDLNIPCRETGKCFDCKSMDTICCQFLITRFSRHTDRIHVILVNDTLGY